MRIRTKTIYFFSIAIGFFLIILIISQLSPALEPKLLWKKDIPSFVWQISFAKYSGDVMLCYQGNRITIISKNGNTKWQWGPILGKFAGSPSISADGKFFIYSSGTKSEREYNEERYIHFYEETGKEIWKKKEPLLIPILSADGKYIVLCVPAGWGGKGEFVDSNGKFLWNIEGAGSLTMFSPDGNYLAVPPYIYDVKGNKCNEKPIVGFNNSFSINGEYIGIEEIYVDPDIETGPEEGIYDKKGNLVFHGKNLISENGKVVIGHLKNKIEAYRFPERIKIGEFPIKRWRYPDSIGYDYRYKYSKVSYNGRYIAIFGQRTDKKSPNNLFVIDINENKIWEEIIPDIGVEENDVDIFCIFFTQDEKYLLFLHSNEETEKSAIYYYQIN
jgi:hypothetical protein